jgi:hypothetical protein
MTDAMLGLSAWVTNAPQGTPRFRQAIHIICMRSPATLAYGKPYASRAGY